MPNFKPDEMQESYLEGKKNGTEILIPISEIPSYWERFLIWIGKRKPRPPDKFEGDPLNTEELEKLRQDKIDAAVDTEMEECCNEKPGICK